MERNIKLLAYFNFFTSLRFHGAILILYFVQVTGSYFLGMSLFSVAIVSSALFEIPTGVFSDKIGRKNTIILGALAGILSALFYAVGDHYSLLFVGAVFEGLSRSFYSGNNDALLHNTLTQLKKVKTYQEYLGKTSSWFQVSLGVSAAVGSLMASSSFSIAMWASLIPQCIGFLLTLSFIEPKTYSQASGNIYKHIKLSAFHLWRNKKLRFLAFDHISRYGVSEAAFQFRAAFVQTLWPLWAIGFSKMLSNIFGSVSFWFSGRIIKKYTAVKMLLYSGIYSRIINVISFVFPTVLSPLLLTTASLWYGLKIVSSRTLMHQEFTEEQRATLYSLTSLLGSLLFGLSSILIGYIADHIGPTKTLLVTELGLIPSLYFAFKLIQLEKSKPENSYHRNDS